MKQPSITSLASSPEDERRARMIKYSIAMGIRVLCLVLLIFVREWWLVIIVAAGAIFLPYFAVILANANGPSRGSRMVRPGAIVRAPQAGDPSHPGGPSQPRDPSHPQNGSSGDNGSRAA